jgi:hypothetical protein
MITFPPCVPEWDQCGHRHSRSCVALLVRQLPSAPVGWRWSYGREGKGWAVWLERIGGAPAYWYVVGLPVATSASDLVAVLWAYVQGYRHDQTHGANL